MGMDFRAQKSLCCEQGTGRWPDGLEGIEQPGHRHRPPSLRRFGEEKADRRETGFSGRGELF